MPAVSQRLFDVWSAFYDIPAVQRAVYKVDHDAVIRALPRDAHLILDVGCGTGLLAARLREHARVVGFDFSAGMLAQAEDRVPERVRGDATQLPFRDASVDVLTCTESFHWYPDQPRAVREFARVLKPGGRALVTFVNPPGPLTSRAAGQVFQLAGQPATFPTRAELRRMAEDAGLRVEEQRPIRLLQQVYGPVLTVAVKPGGGAAPGTAARP